MFQRKRKGVVVGQASTESVRSGRSTSRCLSRNAALLFVLLFLLFVDLGTRRTGQGQLVLRLPGVTLRVRSGGSSPSQAAVTSEPAPKSLDEEIPDTAVTNDDDDDDDDELDGIPLPSVRNEGAGENDDGWGAFEQKRDSNAVELAPLNILFRDQDPVLLDCCPALRDQDRDAVCTCAPVLRKMDEIELNMTDAKVRRWLDTELDQRPMELVSDFYSDWKLNLEANPEATLGQKQVFCEETLLLQADASVKKTMDRREKKLQMGVSEGNLPWLLKLENIARAAKLEKHRASETSLTCLAYIDVIQEEVELKREVEEKERRDRRARERAERQRNRRKRKGTDLTKAKSFDCDELKGKSEFREYYNKICGEDGSRKGRAKILSTTIVDANA